MILKSLKGTLSFPVKLKFFLCPEVVAPPIAVPMKDLVVSGSP